QLRQRLVQGSAVSSVLDTWSGQPTVTGDNRRWRPTIDHEYSLFTYVYGAGPLVDAHSSCCSTSRLPLTRSAGCSSDPSASLISSKAGPPVGAPEVVIFMVQCSAWSVSSGGGDGGRSEALSDMV